MYINCNFRYFSLFSSKFSTFANCKCKTVRFHEKQLAKPKITRKDSLFKGKVKPRSLERRL